MKVYSLSVLLISKNGQVKLSDDYFPGLFFQLIFVLENGSYFNFKKWVQKISTLGVLIFAGTNFCELLLL